MKRILQFVKDCWFIPVFIVIGSAAGYYLGFYFVTGCLGCMMGLFVGAALAGGKRADLELESSFWQNSYLNIKDEQIKCHGIRQENERIIENNKQLDAEKELLANKVVDLEAQLKEAGKVKLKRNC